MSLENMTLEEVRFWSKGCRDMMLAIEKNGIWVCPECKHLMSYPPCDYNICPVCRVEFGYGAKERPEATPFVSAEDIREAVLEG